MPSGRNVAMVADRAGSFVEIGNRLLEIALHAIGLAAVCKGLCIRLVETERLAEVDDGAIYLAFDARALPRLW